MEKRILLENVNAGGILVWLNENLENKKKEIQS